MRRFTVLLVLNHLAVLGCNSSGAPDEPALSTSTDAGTGSDVDAGTDSDAAVTATGELGVAIDALFTDAEASDTFSGSVVVVDDGKIVLEKGYGSADRTSGRKNDADTIFRVGSVSKQFTATAVLLLASEGRLALTDPVSKYFPSYPLASLTRGGVEVTVHHLLSQTSGLPDPGATPAFADIVWKRAMEPAEQIGFVHDLPLVAEPDSQFSYLNYNYLLAALIVEQISGQSYEAFLKERFFTPLGMSSSGTHLASSDAGRAAIGYFRDGDELKSFATYPGFRDHDVSVAFGAGQVYSTVRDLVLWDRALAGETLLPPAQRDVLFAPNLKNYGYGWVSQKVDGVSVAWHNGALSPLGFTSLVVRVPSKDRFVAYLANRDVQLLDPLGIESAVIARSAK